LYNDISYEDAVDLEILIISTLGKICNKTGILTNITDGGEGTLGIKPWCFGTKGLLKSNSGSFKKGYNGWLGKKWTEEQKKNQSLRMKGKKPKCKQPDFRKVCLDTYTGIFYDSLDEGCNAVNIRPNTESTRISRKSKLQRFIYV
jgi:hypothetical protein